MKRKIVNCEKKKHKYQYLVMNNSSNEKLPISKK